VKAEGSVYNVSTAREVTVNRLADLVIRLTGSRSTVQYVPRRDIDTIFRRVLSAERIRHDLGWYAHTSIDDGLIWTLAWMRGE
jgi:nucleoside-diphosphate-sugar epimerase